MKVWDMFNSFSCTVHSKRHFNFSQAAHQNHISCNTFIFNITFLSYLRPLDLLLFKIWVSLIIFSNWSQTIHTVPCNTVGCTVQLLNSPLTLLHLHLRFICMSASRPYCDQISLCKASEHGSSCSAAWTRFCFCCRGVSSQQKRQKWQ